MAIPAAVIKTFPAPNQVAPKSLGHLPSLSPAEFAVPQFRTGESRSLLASPSSFTETKRFQVAPSTLDKRVATESGRNIETPAFSEMRSFSAEGKSQNALQAYNRPLSLEQVRELLNKNK